MALPVELIVFVVLGGIVLLLLWGAATGFLEKDPEVQTNIEQMQHYQDYGDDDF